MTETLKTESSVEVDKNSSSDEAIVDEEVSVNGETPTVEEVPKIDEEDHTLTIELLDAQKEYLVGAQADLNIAVSCLEGCDLKGSNVIVKNEDDEVLAECILSSLEEGNGVNTTGSFSIEIPKRAGEYAWTILFSPAEQTEAMEEDKPPIEEDIPTGQSLTLPLVEESSPHEDSILPPEGDTLLQLDPTLPEADGLTQLDPTLPLVEDTLIEPHEAMQTTYAFRALPHTVGMSAWRDMKPIPVGDEFILNVGASCLSGCSLVGQNVGVYLNDELLGSAELGEPVAPRTSLYWAAVTVTAPDEVGLYKLECRTDPTDLGLDHASSPYVYPVTTTKKPQSQIDITVIGIDERQAISKERLGIVPLVDAEVTVWPTGGFPEKMSVDSEGKVSAKVAWGEYNVSAVCHYYKKGTTTVIIPEGQETSEVTLELDLDLKIIDKSRAYARKHGLPDLP